MTAYNIDLCSFILNEHVNSGGIVVGKVMVKGSGPSRAHNQRKHVTTDKVRWENTKARGSVTVSSRKPLIYPVYLADPFFFHFLIGIKQQFRTKFLFLSFSTSSIFFFFYNFFSLLYFHLVSFNLDPN